MKIINEKSIPQYGIDIPKVIEWVKTNAKNLKDNLREDIKPIVDRMQQFIKELPCGKVYGEEFDTFDAGALRQVVGKYMVPEANEVVALLRKEADGTFVYLTFAQDRALLPNEQNKFIIVKAGSLGDDMQGLFATSPLVIIK